MSHPKPIRCHHCHPSRLAQLLGCLFVAALFRAPLAGQEVARLWEAPGNGAPIELDWAPAGGQFFLYAKPQAILTSPEGQLCLRALPPQATAAITKWQATTGIELGEVEAILQTFVPDADGSIDTASVVRMAGESPLSPSVPALIPNSDLSRFVTKDRTLVIGSQSLVTRIHKSEGAHFLSRPLNAIRSTTDDSQHITLFFAPSFLLREAGAWFQGDNAPLKAPLEALLSEETQAASASLRVDDDEFYIELRFQMTLERRRELKTSFPKLLEKTVRLAEQRLAQLTPVDPHWAALGERLTPMLNLVMEQTRFGWEGDQAVFNTSLPTHAAHNLILAAGLLLAQDRPDAGGETLQQPLSLLDSLQLKCDYRFSQRSFDEAFLGLARELKAAHPHSQLELLIVGDELKKAGVTRNQELAKFTPGRKTVGQLLTLLAMRANPQKVTRPSDPAQVIVWTVGSAPDDREKQVVLITTRRAAAQNNLRLPKYFRKK